ncbi:DUF3489 domain-containing protein [Hydrogenophaga sp. OTU3427]|uniref:DUF3489 domain-containing protein n=1 Tax=Hydrogenophaga sp. OTU3427 TaxID=3043856 RepID=UPI00313B228C
MKPTTPSTKTTKYTKPVAKPSVPTKKTPVKRAAAKNSLTAKSPPKPQPVPVAAASNVATKQSQLISLLESPTGATLAQMMKLTGWQPHTVRGMLSGSLRKRLGLDVRSEVEEGVRVYRIVEGSGK